MMIDLVRGFVWWLGLDKENENFGKACFKFLVVNQSPTSAPLQPWVWPPRPQQRLHIDFAGLFMNGT